MHFFLVLPPHFSGISWVLGLSLVRLGTVNKKCFRKLEHYFKSEFENLSWYRNTFSEKFVGAVFQIHFLRRILQEQFFKYIFWEVCRSSFSNTFSKKFAGTVFQIHFLRSLQEQFFKYIFWEFCRSSFSNTFSEKFAGAVFQIHFQRSLQEQLFKYIFWKVCRSCFSNTFSEKFAGAVFQIHFLRRLQKQFFNTGVPVVVASYCSCSPHSYTI